MSLKPTSEQQAILDAACSGGTVAIAARAGTGKTSTLRMLAAARPSTKMLYVAYNKAIQVEAERSFPANVTCKTAHALAYRSFGAPLRGRLAGPRMTARQNAQVLGIKSAFGLDAQRLFEPPTLASLAMGMVARFCRSAEPRIAPWMVNVPEGLSEAEGRALGKHLLLYAKRAWADLTTGPKGRLRPTHDVYLKQWQLSKPSLTGWDVILYDEAQDADPAIADVVEHQGHAQLVAVGDSAQAIYGWRGAGDFLARVPARHRLVLTQSWRFGPAVAEEANVWLGLVDAEAPVRGNPARHSRLEPLEQPDAVLCRSNAGTIDQLLAAHTSGVSVHLVGGGREMRALAEAAGRMHAGQPAAHPELVAFGSWAEVVDYAESDPAGSDLAVAVRMIERYGADEVVRAIDGCVAEHQAELVVSTAHKAKGLEWGRVRIGTDFREPLDKRTGEALPIPAADAMLAYVSVTRAQDVLDNAGLAWVHSHLEALGTPAGETVDREITPPAEPAPGGREGSCVEATPAEGPSPSEDPDGYLAAYGLRRGELVLVAEERGRYVLRDVSRDGSLTCYQPGRSEARSFRPEWCCAATRPGRDGKAVQVRSVPRSARAARADWRASHSLVGSGSPVEVPVVTIAEVICTDI